MTGLSEANLSSFRCAKCSTMVDHDSNLLLLSNGKPICENCSYNCRVCDRKIDDLVSPPQAFLPGYELTCV